MHHRHCGWALCQRGGMRTNQHGLCSCVRGGSLTYGPDIGGVANHLDVVPMRVPVAERLDEHSWLRAGQMLEDGDI